MNNENGTTDFTVQLQVSEADDGTIVMTAAEQIDERMTQQLYAALQKYDYNKQMSGVGFSQSTSNDELTVDVVETLANGINTTLGNVLSANRFVRRYIHIDDVMSATYNTVRNNINTDYRLVYSQADGRGKKSTTAKLVKVKEAIEQFNRSVRLRSIITDSILMALTDGNCVFYLRTDGGNAVIDIYPLGVADITDYTVNGDPVAQINLSEFKTRLKKTYAKTKKGKALFFENVAKEIQASFPEEVVTAYQDGDNYAKLNVRNTGVLRINNLGYKYGASHFFGALRPTAILESIEEADIINNKAKAKKIIHQKLRKEVMGPNSDYNRKGMEFTAYAHEALMSAWQNKTVVYTSIPAVESITYVEPSVEGAPTDKIALYRNEKMTALGITFLDPELNSMSSANLSVKQLMKTVDRISAQLSDILHRFYEVWLEEQGLDASLAPDIYVMDSEQMALDVKKDLAEFFFSKLNLSYETTLQFFGMDVDDEVAKRKLENEGNLQDVFTPRASQYTASGTTSPGRPTGSDEDKQGKQEYDKTYTEGNR